MSERFTADPASRAVSWTRDGAAWRVVRGVRDGAQVVVVTRDGAEVVTLERGALWDLIDGVGLLFDGAVRHPDDVADGPPAPRDGPAQIGARWTQEQDAALAAAWRGGATIAALADRFERTTGGIVSRLVHVGVCEDRDAARAEDRRRR
jgi:hypothetical protein